MEFVRYEVKDEIAVLTVDRPKALNALNSAVLAELDSLLDEAAKNPPRCLIVTGGGEKAFVAGADIAEMRDLSPAGAEQFSSAGMVVMDKLEGFPCPVIAAVNGFALGGGCELALACDFRIASEKASFAFPEVGLGIPPGFGGMQRMVRAIGVGKAKELVYTAGRIKAPEALALGLVNAVYPPEELMDKVMNTARAIAKNAPLAVRAAKAAINGGAVLGLAEAAASEIPWFAGCFETKDQRNAMTAFVEKRDAEPFVGA
ncbi:enoyl-CoA hydratase/isomerase family protein [Ruminococcaceae bacterium OttesenSCG-928-D13]|nr:enoyl-CoA hydratase/isomerase family protein [Ruminococcaceae bacterium OttesenSCG-928-D13]